MCGRDRVRKRGSALSYRVKNLRKMNDNSIVVYIGLYIISSQTKCHESSGKLVYLFSLSSKPSFPVILLLLQTTDNCIQFTNFLLQRLCAHQQPGLDSRLAYPRPRPRLDSFKTKTKTKTQQFQDQDLWKRVLRRLETKTQVSRTPSLSTTNR